MKGSTNKLPLLVALAVGGVLLWGANRSFDFTDEGDYYLSAVHPEEVPDRQTTYFLFGRVLYALSGHNIVITRVLVAGLVLLATFIFVGGLRRFLAAFAPVLDPRCWLGVAVVAGSALAFSIAPLAPSYNLLNAICLLTTAGLVLRGSSSPTTDSLNSPRSGWPALFLAAVMVVADFFIKFSTSVVLAVLLSAFFLTTSRMKLRTKAMVLVAVASIGSLAAAGYVFSVQSLSAWRDSIGGTLWALRQHGYLLSQVVRYWNDFQTDLIDTLWTYGSVFNTLFVAGAVLLAFRRRPAAQRWLALLGFIIAGYLGFQAAPANLAITNGSLGNRFLLAVISAFGLAAALTWIVRAPPARASLPQCSWRILIALVVLALLPFAGSFGTSNEITTNAIYQLAPWLALIALLLAWLAHCWQARWLPGLGVLFVAAVTLSQFVHGYIFTPYRVPSGRLAQTVATDVGNPGTSLRLDPASHEFILAVRAQLASHGFRPGDDVFAFFNLPGLIFAVGGVSPGHPWYFSGNSYALFLDDGRLRDVAPTRRSRAFIVQNGEIGEFIHYLRHSGLAFPEAYERCGPALHNPLTNEVVQVWRPMARK